jgi:hypothetical protein
VFDASLTDCDDVVVFEAFSRAAIDATPLISPPHLAADSFGDRGTRVRLTRGCSTLCLNGDTKASELHLLFDVDRFIKRDSGTSTYGPTCRTHAVSDAGLTIEILRELYSPGAWVEGTLTSVAGSVPCLAH